MKRRFSLLVLTAAMALAATTASAAPRLTEMPSKFRENDVFLQVGVNGAKPLWMKLDIGNDRSVLAAATAASLGVQGDANLQIGATGFSNVALLTGALPICTGPDGAPLAGTLGEDFLGGRPMFIDTVHHKVWLAPAAPTGPDDGALPIKANFQTH